MWWGIVLFCCCTWSAFLVIRSVQQEINIGAFFYENELDLEKEFVNVVKDINRQENSDTFQLNPIITWLKPEDSSLALQEYACRLIDNGVVAIFGPSSKAASDIIRVVCNSTGIPHIEFDVAHEENMEEQSIHHMTLNLYPPQLMLSKAYADIIQSFGWRKYTIVYNAEDAKASARLQDLLQLREIHSDIVRVRKYQTGDDFRDMWKSIHGERRVILDCTSDMLIDLLNTSSEYELTGQFNHIFLTNLETYTDHLEELAADNMTFAVNMTAARILLNDGTQTSPSGFVTQDGDVVYENFEPMRTLLHDLLYDGVQLFAQAWRDASLYFGMSPPRVSCDLVGSDQEAWQLGRYLMESMKGASGVNRTNFHTSDLQFDKNGQRISFKIDIYDPIDNKGIAIWDTKGDITHVNADQKMSKKIIYRVATRIGAPYFDYNNTAVELNLTGNAIYQGYAVDLIEAIAKEVGFDYMFVPVADQQYGKLNKETKQWNGIIGEIINNDAHMGICDLTITQARRTAVDFTVPFMQLGIRILALKKQDDEDKLFGFLIPFKSNVWYYILISIITTSFAKVFLARISKHEWTNPHPCDKDPDELEFQWHLHNSFWLTVASITTAGCDILPRSPQVRLFEATWWLFAIIVANSYTAQLAAYLTSNTMKEDINSLKDLSEQKDVKFGTIAGGSTYNLLAESNETVHRLAFNIMENDDPSAYTKDNLEGVKRVLSGRGTYMFLMETTSLEYHRERQCNLRSVGDMFSEKYYAIAVPFGADYRMTLSVAILQLSERNALDDLKQKWWKNTNSTCPEEVTEESTQELDFWDIRGIFYTLYFGILFGYIIGIIEFLVYVQQVALEEHLSYKEALKNEIKFVLCVWNNKKPIKSRTPESSISATSRGSLEKSIESTPKSERRIVLGRSAEEMRELRERSATARSSSSDTVEQREAHV